jgi:hypothetical protein
VTQGLHRAAAVTGLVLLVVHIVTMVVDPHAELGLADVVVPFGAGYRALWTGLGTLAVDLLLLTLLTTLWRRRLSPRLWRGIHLTAYAACGVAIAHGIGAGTDAGLDMAEAVRLRGRGGGASPFARKARAVRDTRGHRLVVGNGSEGEPASRKDAWLMTYAPHLVLDGIELTAAAIGAREARLVVGSPHAAESLVDALDERAGSRLTRRRVRTTVVAVAERFISGESSATVCVGGGSRTAGVSR